jgi:leucyl-tRNA synthetase
LNNIQGTGVVTSVPSDSPDDFATLADLKKKHAFYKIKEEWVKDFEPVPIIRSPTYGDLAAQKACEEFKVRSPKDKDQLALAKEKVYKEGFYNGTMIIGDFAGKSVQDAKPLIRQQMMDDKQAAPYWEPENQVMSRSGDECVVCLTDQWYLNYGEQTWKEQAAK